MSECYQQVLWVHPSVDGMPNKSPASSTPPSSPSSIRSNFGSPAAPCACHSLPARHHPGCQCPGRRGESFISGLFVKFSAETAVSGNQINQAVFLPKTAFDLSCLGPAAGSREPVCFQLPEERLETKTTQINKMKRKQMNTELGSKLDCCAVRGCLASLSPYIVTLHSTSILRSAFLVFL